MKGVRLRLLALTVLGISRMICGLAAYAVPAEELMAEARGEEAAGNSQKAVALYEQWLEEYSGTEGSVDVLLHAAPLCREGAEVLSFMERNLLHIPTADYPGVYERMADLESALGRLNEAASHYEQAALRGYPGADRCRSKILVLRLQMGDYAHVLRVGRELSMKVSSPVLRAENLAVAALAAGLTGNSEKALSMVEEAVGLSNGATPLPLLVKMDISRLAGKTDAYHRAVRKISSEYPDSAAFYLANEQIRRWATPFLLENNSRMTLPGAPVQTGAFSERSSAALLREKLENNGFSAWMEKSESDRLWRVFVHDADGKVRARLEKQGFIQTAAH